jgi:preprotein translocase subunit SecD
MAEGVKSQRQRNLLVSLVAALVISFGGLAATLAAGWSPKLGLDLAGGLSVVYKPEHSVKLSDLQVATQIISNRVNGLGVSGAEVNLQGTNIVVSVPGVTNARQTLEQIGQTAQLLFRPVYCYVNTAKKILHPVGTSLPQCSSSYLLTSGNIGLTQSAASGFNWNSQLMSGDPVLSTYSSTPPSADDPKSIVLLPDIAGNGLRYLLGPAELSGTAIKSAFPQQNQTNEWVVGYTLTSSGSKAWDSVAQTNFHHPLAIELDGVVQTAPFIQPTESTFTSFGGSGQISGSFTEEAAKHLALVITYGALPVRLLPLTTQTVSPTLGHSALVAGLGAGLAGLILVLLYTLVYYRSLGLIIVLGLGVSAASLYAIISSLGHTTLAPSFDLAGVTGLIVSIGITVDSFIVYFERLKDETRAGRSLRVSVDRGFHSAWRTVLAADTVSLLAALLLYWLAAGAVRGFAFFLGLSTLLDILVTWFFTRPFIILLGRRSSGRQGAFSIAAGVGAGVEHD